MSPVTSFTASLGHDGRIDIFALALGPQVPVGRGVTVWRARRAAPGGGWPTWVNEGKPGAGAAVGVRSVVDAEGRGHVLAKAGGAHLWFKERGPADAFSGWQPLGVPAADVPDDKWGFIYMWGATRADGQIDVIGTANSNSDRGIFHRSRPAPGAPWSEWSHLLGDNDFFGDVTAATAYDGGLDIVTPIEVFPSKGGDEIGLSHRRRGPDGTWTNWTLRPPAGRVQRRHHPGADRRLGQPAGTGTVRGVEEQHHWHSSQTAGGGWSDFASLGTAGGTITGIAAAAGADDGLDLCVTLQDNTVAHRRQQGQGAPWSAWTSLDRPDTSAIANPVLILDAQKCLNLLLSRPGKEG